MKKIYFSAGLMLAFALASCNSSDPEQKLTASYVTTNLVTNLSTGAVSVSPALYTLNMDFVGMTTTVSTQNLNLGGNQNSFMSAESSFLSNTYTYTNAAGESKYGQIIKVASLKANLNNNSFEPIIGNEFVVSSMNFYNSLEPGSLNPAPFNPVVVAQYNVSSEYLVKTFATDAVYEGTTTTTYPDRETGEMATFENKKMQYRFVIDTKENTAKFIIYNARFAQSMPIELSSIVVEGLKVAWENGSYTITGTDLVPYVYDGGNKVPYESFKFNSITFAPTNSSLTQGSLEYDVAGIYHGSFQGSYLVEPGDK